MKVRLFFCDFYEVVREIETRRLFVDSKYKVLVLYFFGKCWSTLRSLHVLCNEQFLEDSRTVLRSLLEATVNLRYIATQPEELTKRFSDFATIEAIRFDKVLNRYCDSNPDEEIIRDLLGSKSQDERDAEMKERQHMRKVYGPLGSSWSGKELEDMARSVGMDFHYILYRMFCRSAHPSSAGIQNYIYLTEEGHLAFCEPSEEEIQKIWWTACIYFLFVLEQVDIAFNLGLENKVVAIDKKLKDARPKKH